MRIVSQFKAVNAACITPLFDDASTYKRRHLMLLS